MKSRKIGGIILTILLFIAAIITIVPFVWMFIHHSRQIAKSQSDRRIIP